MRILSVATLLCLSIASGCAFSAWEAEEYVVKQGPPREFRGEALGDYPAFTVDGVVIKVFLKGSVEGIHQGKGPYTLHVSAWQVSDHGSSVRLVGLSAKDSARTEHELVRGDELPASLAFKELKLSGTTQTCEWATWSTRRSISASPKKGESVAVSVEVEVERGGKSTRKTLQYNFTPRVRSGKVKWPTV